MVPWSVVVEPPVVWAIAAPPVINAATRMNVFIFFSSILDGAGRGAGAAQPHAR
ncbi:MAG: hypothetical protein AVDCRST_MAG39-2177 [uncultured Sphingomonadaceae bacterium]|uniref:Uncharacterized protein n=1 Tax=uncultured Sphingomonadaceae bacterium TaxID=169976 RepID=A0A6J4T452_9SPHN|nr:MAG: hypothetical protein AVDCRST_MAG39-2177 [uncultured Sphingomonadaceae bacterium]